MSAFYFHQTLRRLFQSGNFRITVKHLPLITQPPLASSNYLGECERMRKQRKLRLFYGTSQLFISSGSSQSPCPLLFVYVACELCYKPNGRFSSNSSQQCSKSDSCLPHTLNKSCRFCTKQLKATASECFDSTVRGWSLHNAFLFHN